MKVLYLSILLAFSFNNVYAQVINVESNIYYASYSMKSLRALQTFSRRYNPVPLKPVSSFPAYFAYDLQTMFKINDIGQLGIWGSYRSTGARNTYADYSGAYTMDFLVDSFVFGPSYQGSVRTRVGAIQLNFRVGYSKNSLVIISTLETPDFQESKATYISGSLPIIAGLSYRKQIWKGYLNTSVLYEYGKLGYPLSRNNALIDWSGLKLGLGLGFGSGKVD